ncbi:hypothetical protein OSB04_002185 [Centaurea solstitialis]|uniref:TTF-type domain-containing protein n=1 Tax=Centaurea solstitialis TaxID=347529 RepID=A0AA38TSU6_9ASTR|nr:hypothetical protein OSB04_002185 [Centaurea solstitialis]
MRRTKRRFELLTESESDNASKAKSIIMLKFFKKVGKSSSSDIPKTTNVEEMKLEDIICKRDLANLEISFSNEEMVEFYSIELEAAFCLCCYLFKTDLKNQGGADNFVKGGFKAWNKRERLDIHSNGGPHNLAIQKCQNLMKQAQSIATTFDKQTDSKKDKNQTKIYASINCVRFLLRQGLPFRGHNEGVDSRNKGNFLELLHFYAERNDKVGNAVLKNAPRNSQMKSCSIQKDIEDSFFSILVDESRDDVSCKEQMALVLRFVNDKGPVVGRFVGIKHVDDTSSLSLKATNYSVLSEHELSQGYDGASNMRGTFNGSKTLIMNDSLLQRINHDINNFFELTSRLLNMIGSSYKHRDKLRDKQATRDVAALADSDLESGTGLNPEIGIKRPSDTRWGSHYGSLLNIKALYPSICEVLETL